MKDKVKDKVLVIKIKDQEIQKKCKILYRMNGVIIETLLKLLFERVDVADILKAYVENEAEGVRELIIKAFKPSKWKEKQHDEDDLIYAFENEDDIRV
jgi:hypothetical protein